MAFGYSRNERVYVVNETAYGTFGNLTGPTNSNCMRHISCTLDPTVELYDNPSKTGSRSVFPGIVGRRFGSWNIKQTLDGNGAAGVLPDSAPILRSIFGAAGVVVGATSVTYALTDTPLSFSLFRYRQPSTLFQQAGLSCLVKEATFNLGQNVADWEAMGECLWVLDSEQYGTASATAKGGLTPGSYPVEPSAPVTNGGPVAGFTGSISIGGNVVASVRTAQIKVGINNDHVKDTFGSFYPTSPLADVRKVTGTFDIYDADTSDLVALRAAGLSKSLTEVDITLGTIAGNIWSFVLKGGQFSFPKVTEPNARFGLTCEASFSGSSLTAKDEFALVVT